MADKRPALGKGLSALIPGAASPRDVPGVDIDLLSPNPYQPRTHADQAQLGELAQSIRSNGVIQPIVVRRVGAKYEIIAGERRWRAAQQAGLQKVPIVVRDIPAEKLLEVALIENLQREDLNPIEKTQSYRKLGDEFRLRQEQIAAAVGKDRSSIANYLRLLKLPDEVRQQVALGTLSMGHARALLGIENKAALERAAREVVARGLSVRETETLVKRLVEGPPAPAGKRTPDVHVRAAEERLRVALGTRVRIVKKKGKGRIEIDFTSEDELQRLYELLTEG
jgi:ParB family chromosome partitioning protein